MPVSLIGLDFDNTIVCYDALFREMAISAGLVGAGFTASREALRSAVRREHGDGAWAALQATIYGPALHRAQSFAGALECIRTLLRGGRPIAIVSHKTRVAAADPAVDLHAHAWRWLEASGLLDPPPRGLTRERVFFEETLDAKITRIRQLGCSHFVDDLSEVFEHPAFPAATMPLLFDPEREGKAFAGRVVHSWREIEEYLVDGAIA